MIERALIGCALAALIAGCAVTREDTADADAPEEAGGRAWTSPVGLDYTIRPTANEDSLCHNFEEAGEPALEPEEPIEAGCAADDFCGTARAKVKTSIVNAAVETFASVPDLLATLDTRVPNAPATQRAPEERRNVTVDALIYAAKAVEDHDFHLIVGTEPVEDGEVTFFNVEVSGLPRSGVHRTPLRAARDAYRAIFAGAVPGKRYATYDPPLPVRITGSLFYDTEHDSEIERGECSPIGTGICKPCTAWEIHPVTAIESLEQP